MKTIQQTITNKQNELPSVIDYRITAMCNMQCRFCFGTRKEEMIDLTRLDLFFRTIKDNGVDKVVLTGGEPTLSSNFENIVHILRNLGFRMFLSTNGIFWNSPKLRKLVLENFECIALPMEASNKKIHNRMRIGTVDHYALIMDILEKIRDCSAMKIKLETVVTKKNFEYIERIPDDLPVEPDMWKLYQLCKHPLNTKYYIQNCINDKEFLFLVDSIKERYKKTGIKISTLLEKDRNEKHLFLEPDGTLMIVSDNIENAIGNYNEDMSEILGKIPLYLKSNHVNNSFKNSFIEKREHI